MELILQQDSAKNISNVKGAALYLSPGWQDSAPAYVENGHEEVGYSEGRKEEVLYSES